MIVIVVRPFGDEGPTTAKIREISEALKAAGFVTLDAQTRALGLARSTTWAVLQNGYKHSGISAQRYQPYTDVAAIALNGGCRRWANTLKKNLAVYTATANCNGADLSRRL